MWSASSPWPQASWNRMPPLPPARTMGTSPEGAGRAESLVRARAAARAGDVLDGMALEDLEALGAGERLVPGLHAGVAVGDADDVEAGPDLVVLGEEAVGVRDEDATAAVAAADLDLRDGVAGGACGVVGPGEELELAGLVDDSGRVVGAVAVTATAVERDRPGAAARRRGRRRRRLGRRRGGRLRTGRPCGRNRWSRRRRPGCRRPGHGRRRVPRCGGRRGWRSDVTASSAKTSAMSPPPMQGGGEDAFEHVRFDEGGVGHGGIVIVVPASTHPSAPRRRRDTGRTPA